MPKKPATPMSLTPTKSPKAKRATSPRTLAATAADRIDALEAENARKERQLQVWQLRLAGVAPGLIGQRLNMPVEDVRAIIRKMGVEHTDSTLEIPEKRAVEVARLDEMQVRLWQQFNATNGTDQDIVNGLLRVINSRAKILGLHNHTVKVDMSTSREDLTNDLMAFLSGDQKQETKSK